MSIKVSLACFFAAVPTARQFSTPTRVVAGLPIAVVFKHLVTVLSAVEDIAQKVHDEEFYDNMLSFTTEPPTLIITIDDSISDNLCHSKLAGEWKLTPSFHVTLMM